MSDSEYKSALIARLFDRLAGEDSIAIVELDTALVVTAALNADWLIAEPGQSALHSLPFLVAMDTVLADLTINGAALVLANIGLSPLDETPVKATAQIFRVDSGYLVYLSRLAAPSQLEHEVIRQVRARRIAEAELHAAESALVASAERLQDTNVQLARANRELDNFADIISHDLKAPLRAMRHTLEHLASGPLGAEQSGADNRKHQPEPASIVVPAPDFQRLHRQTLRMSDMISGLLSYARSTSDLDLIEPLNTKRLVTRIIDSVTTSHLGASDAQMQFVLAGTWPEINTVPDALDVVLRNIISNAIKHHDRPAGHIRISANPESTPGDPKATSAILIRVADDGPGIPHESQSMVFKPFRSAKGVLPDGSGLGLSLVKKLCDRFQATITIESPIDGSRGTALNLCWPTHPLNI